MWTGWFCYFVITFSKFAVALSWCFDMQNCFIKRAVFTVSHLCVLKLIVSKTVYSEYVLELHIG